MAEIRKVESGNPFSDEISPVLLAQQAQEGEEVVTPAQPAQSTPTPQAQVTTTNPDGSVLDLAIDKALSSSTAPSTTTAEGGDTPAATADTPEIPELSDAEKQSFFDQFKKVVGVDVKEAMASYEAMVKANKQLQQQFVFMQAQAQEQAARVLLSNLSNKWGVTDAELDRRVNTVLDVVNAMEPAQRAQYDSIDGFDAIWKAVETKRGVTVSKAPAVGGTTSTISSSKTYSKRELMSMMVNNPDGYNLIAPDLERAYKEGRVVD